ncbi:centrosomal protein CEP57L1 isoform X2 [Pogoniulus pusillus]|uniref:centrosomal protein CEP57L1 isoform X2 n=1 Tax=Pogoniulus pusillus TaxID=488313 RepID=UPI0030B952B3
MHSSSRHARESASTRGHWKSKSPLMLTDRRLDGVSKIRLPPLEFPKLSSCDHSRVLQAVDSESKNSYIGSFLQPPNEMLPAAFASTEPKKLAAVGSARPSMPNHQAVVAALKTLQEKICRLELEKSQAEDNLCSLSIAAAQHKKALECESHKKNIAHQGLMQEREDVRAQLNAAQSRCSLLEKQLDYMRKMVHSAELERKKVLEQQAKLQKEEDQKWLELHAKVEKLEMLEKECLKLSAAQRTAEEKIKCLEEKLWKEEHQCEQIKDKAAQPQTRFERNRILVPATSQSEPSRGNGKKKKKKVQKLKRETQELKQGAAHVRFKCGDQKEAKEIVRENVPKSWPGQKSRSSLQLLKTVQELQARLKHDST